MPIIIALLLLLVSGLIAAAGDFMGQRAAKRKVRIGKLRPRHTSRLIAVLSGILISLATYGAMFLLYKDFRDALTHYQSVKAQFNQVRGQRDQAERDLQVSQNKLQDADKQVAAANANVAELQTNQVELVKKADAKRREVDLLAAQVQAKQAEVERANRELRHSRAENAAVQSQLHTARAELTNAKGKLVLGQIDLSKLKNGEILLPKGAEVTRVEVAAADAGQVGAKLRAGLEASKQRLANELNLVVDPQAGPALDKFISHYPYADPPVGAVVSFRAAGNVIAGETVMLSFEAVAVKPLLHAGDLLLTLRVADTGMRITARGHDPRDVAFTGGISSQTFAAALGESGDEFVAAMFDLGFNPAEGSQAADLAAPVLKIADLGSGLLTRERPYVIQLATKQDLTSTQWPAEVTINVYKEPGS